MNINTSTVRRLQFRLQRGHPSETVRQTSSSVTRVDSSMCYWLLDFLLQRSQVVKMNGIVSSTINLNTGTPQGCVLSPVLYSLFTNDCVLSPLLCTTCKVRR